MTDLVLRLCEHVDTDVEEKDRLVNVIFISRDGYPSESTITINFMDFDIVSRQHADFADPGTSAADNSAHASFVDMNF